MDLLGELRPSLFRNPKIYFATAFLSVLDYRTNSELRWQSDDIAETILEYFIENDLDIYEFSALTDLMTKPTLMFRHYVRELRRRNLEV